MGAKTTRFYSQDEVVSAWSTRLATEQHGFFITLNTRHCVDSYSDKKTHQHLEMCEPIIGEISKRLNQYCFGRRCERGEANSRLTIIPMREIGAETGRVHIHLLAMHDGSVRRTTEQVQNFVAAQWKKMFGTSHGSSQVDVRPVENVEKLLRYVTKQVELQQRRFGEIG